MTELGYVDDLDALLVGEPSKYQIVYAHMGSIHYTVRARGKEAHSAMPSMGNNAITQLATFMSEIEKK